ncbi:hypothetical protein [Paenibacillus sp. PAMC21692]|uniref:hypothetical protein n=1 Tax=Paenibacillus sp. PAMC21692 TaxID=2762320 RepID=UPI00164E4EBA|nr:hypothetical protein [Paenibacillus sp. PAMC21692]QNK59817.1 hypothetical protein H7F31_13685 [Paenibacillus sp. PAMC21692]
MDRSKAPKQRKAADTAASVQAFAGSILNKHRPGGGRSQFTNIPMLHAKPKGEQAAVQQRIHIHVTPPRAEDPRTRRKPEERKTDRIIEREKVRVEHKTIIVREIVKIIDNQRTVRAQAMTAPVRLEASPHDRQSPGAATSMKQQASGSRREDPYSGTLPAATTLATGLHKGIGKLVRQSPFIERLRSIIASVEPSTTPTSGRQAKRGKTDGSIAAASYVAAKKAPLMHAKREETTKRETRAELSPKRRISDADQSVRQANTTAQAAVNKAKRAKQKAERAEENLKRQTVEAADSVRNSLQSAKAAEDKVKETEQRAGRREAAAKRLATEAVEAANQAARSSQVATFKAKEAERRADHAEQVLQTKKTGTKRRKADSAVPELQPVQTEELTGDKKQTAKRQQKRSDRNPQNNEAVSDRGEKLPSSGNSSTKTKGRRQTPNLVHKQSNSAAAPDEAITSSVQRQPVRNSKAELQNPANKGGKGLGQQGTNASTARSFHSKTVANPNQNKFFAQRVFLKAGISPIRLLSMSPSWVTASSINNRNNKSHRNSRLIRDWNPTNPTNSPDSLPERAQSAGGSAKPPIQAKKLFHRQIEGADVAGTESSPRKRNSPASSPVEESSRTRLKTRTGTELQMGNAVPILLTALKHHRTSAGVNAGRRFPELLNARRRNSESGALNVSGTGSQKRPGSVSSQGREAAPVNSHGSASYEARRDRIGDQKQANLSSQLVTGRSRNNTAQPSAPLLVRRALKAGTSAELMEEGLKSPLTTGRIHRLYRNRNSAERRIQRLQPSASENKPQAQADLPRRSGSLVLRRNKADRDIEKKSSGVSRQADAPNRQDANRSHRTTETTVAQASRSKAHEAPPLHAPATAAPSWKAGIQQRSGTDSHRHMTGQAAAYGSFGLVLRQLPETFGARMMRLAEQGHTGQTASATSRMARGMLIGRKRPSFAPSLEERSPIASAVQQSTATAKYADSNKQEASRSLPKQGALVQRSAEGSRENGRQHMARVIRPGKTALAESTREQGRTIANAGPVISQPLTVAQRTSQKESARQSAPATSGLTIRESATISNSALGSAAIVQRAGSTGQDSVSASMSGRGRLSLTPAIARRTAESKGSPLIGRQFTASAIRGDHDRTVRQISSTNPGTFSSLAYNRSALNDAGLESEQPAFGASAHNGSPLGLTHRSAPQQPAEASRQIKVDAPRELEPEKLQRMIMKLPQLNPEAIADRVYKALERKMKLEQRRNGY